MKLKLKSLVLAALLILAIGPASADVNESKGKDISRLIGSSLSLPASLISPGMDTEIKVDFRINADGSVEVIRVMSSSPELSAHVKKQFQSVRFSDASFDTARIYRLPVKYRVL